LLFHYIDSGTAASERASQKLDALLTQGGPPATRTELHELAVRKIREDALEVEVAEAAGRSSRAGLPERCSEIVEF